MASNIVYDDDNAINIDYDTVLKFSKLGIPPPMDTDNLDVKIKEIIAVREGLKMAGVID